jgi:outer membrane protein
MHDSELNRDARTMNGGRLPARSGRRPGRGPGDPSSARPAGAVGTGVDAHPHAVSRPARSTGIRTTGAAVLLAAAAAALVLLPSAVLPAPASAQERPGTLEELMGLVGVERRSLSLDEAISTALDRSRELRQAREALNEAEGQVTEAWGNLYPSLDLTGSLTRNISPPVTFLPEVFLNPDADPDALVPIAFGLDNQWSTTVQAEQILFDGRAFIGVGAAARFRELQDEQVRGRVHEVVTRVRTSYYQLLLSVEQARLLERSLDRVVQSLGETRALNRAGLASDYDVLRLEVELANLEPQLRRAANAALRVERELVTELDLPEGTRLQVQGELAQMELDDLEANTPENRALLVMNGVEVPEPTDEEGIESLFRRARVTSSRLHQARLGEDLRHAEFRAEQAELLPRVSLFGSYQVQAQQDGGLDFFGTSRQRGYGRLVGIQVSIPIFSGFQRTARVDQRRSALRSARLETEVAGDRLRDDLKNVLDQVEEARLAARAQRLAVRQATRGYEIASAEFREGLGSQLELTDAEVALRQSEFNYAEAVYEYLEARARLDELVGDVPVPGGR